MKKESEFIPTISQVLLSDCHGELKISVDFDYKTETVRSLKFSGELVTFFSKDIEILENLLQDIRPYELASIIAKESLSTIIVQSIVNLFNDYMGLMPINFSSEYICACFGLTKSELIKECRKSNISFGELMAKTKVTTGCGSCLHEVQRIYHQELYSTLPTENSELFPSFKHFTYAETLVKIDDLKMEFLQSKKLANDYFIISNSRGYQLELFSQFILTEEIKKEFSLFVFSRTGLLISFFN